YLVPAYGQTGRTFAYRIGLTHDAGSAETPDGLGWLSKLVQEHDVEYSVDVVIDPKKMGEDFWSVLTALRDLFDNNPIQPLYLSNLSESSTVREVAVKGFRVQGVGWETPMVPGPLLVTDRTNVTLS